MNKLEVGMYVRFENVINKIIDIDEEYVVFDMNWYDHLADEVSSMKYDLFMKEYNPRYSYNIIDLIEVGDYVNGEKVLLKNEGYIKVGTGRDYIVVNNEKFIKSIVTKEQFKSMEYKL